VKRLRLKREEILRRLNQVYAVRDPGEKALLAGIKRAVARTIRDRW